MLEHYFVRPRSVDRIRALWLGSAIDTQSGWLSDKPRRRLSEARSSGSSSSTRSLSLVV